MWKQWCGIGKNTDLQTDWHPVALSIHITTVGCFKTRDSWRRWIIPPLVWFLAWKCPSLTLTPHGISRLLPQGVPLAACGSVQWIPFPGMRSSPCWGHMLQLGLRVSEYLWFQRVGGGHGWWEHCSLHRAVAMQLKALTGFSSLHHSHVLKYTLMPCFPCQTPPNCPM